MDFYSHKCKYHAGLHNKSGNFPFKTKPLSGEILTPGEGIHQRPFEDRSIHKQNSRK
jgi:hypothetical protein